MKLFLLLAMCTATSGMLGCPPDPSPPPDSGATPDDGAGGSDSSTGYGGGET
jgi:hypothetical protein